MLNVKPGQIWERRSIPRRAVAPGSGSFDAASKASPMRGSLRHRIWHQRARDGGTWTTLRGV